MQNRDIKVEFYFLKKVAMLGRKYGSTAAQMEIFLNSLADRLNVKGVFQSNPSNIVIALKKNEEDQQKIEIIPNPPTGLDFDKLARLGEIINQFIGKELNLEQTMVKINEIDQHPPPWSNFSNMLGYVFVGLGLAPLLEGSWNDSFFSALFSALVFGIVALSKHLGAHFERMLPFIGTFTISILASLANLYVKDLNLIIVILSANAILLPGYSVSLGAGEIIAGRIVSGFTQLVSGLRFMIKQVVGAWLGMAIMFKLIPHLQGIPTIPVSRNAVYFLMPLLLAGLCQSFQIAKRDFFWAVICCLIAYFSVVICSNYFGTNIGSITGTVIAVIFSNLWSKFTSRPLSILLIPSIVLLVSGTIGFRGLATIASGDIEPGLRNFLQMFIVAVNIFVGTMIGFTIVPAEKTL